MEKRPRHCRWPFRLLAGCCLGVLASACGSGPNEQERMEASTTASASTQEAQARGLYVRGAIRGDGTVDVRDISYNGVAERKDLTRIGGRYLDNGDYRLTAQITNRAANPVKLRFRALWYGPRGETLGPGQDTAWTPLSIPAEQSAELSAVSTSGSPQFFFLVVAIEE
ncbi:MAG: hypothetical protein ACFB20_10815 [Opitutales bacterium]